MSWLAGLLGFAFGAFAHQELTRWLRRKRRQILSNWEPGMTIITSDGETLYVCAIEPTDSPREPEAKSEG